MPSEIPLSRRGVVTSGAAAAAGLVGAVALTGRAGSADAATATPSTTSSSSPSGAVCASGSPSPTASPSRTASPSPSGTPSASPSSGVGSVIATLASVPVGGAIATKKPDGTKIIVAQPTAGKVAAFTSVCTHQGCQVTLAGTSANCPCHGAAFNALTGAVTAGPAVTPLATVPVAVSCGNIVLA